jgi:hypothetical protein
MPDRVSPCLFLNAHHHEPFGHSSLRWFEACACTPALSGLPQSASYLRTFDGPCDPLFALVRRCRTNLFMTKRQEVARAPRFPIVPINLSPPPRTVALPKHLGGILTDVDEDLPWVRATEAAEARLRTGEVTALEIPFPRLVVLFIRPHSQPCRRF